MTTSLPLDGALVLDLADEPAVAAGRYLADLGARVVRVESASGDRLRRVGPWVDGEPGIERGLRHLLYNQGKQSLALALDAPEAWDVIERLAERADVVIGPVEKSERARRAFERLRRNAEAGAEGAPSVIDIVFRRGDPEQAATDLIAMAAGSQLVCNGFPDTAPDYPAGKLGYKQTAYCAVAAAVSAIWQRWRGGGAVGSVVSMQEAVASTMIQAANQNLYVWHGMIAERDGTGGLKYPVVGAGFGAYEQGRFEDGEIVFINTPGSTYQCADGKWVTYLGNPTSTAWENFPNWYAEVTGDDTLLQEPWTSQDYRVAHREEMIEFTRRFCAAQNREDLVRRAQAEGDLGLPVQTAHDLVGDIHLQERGFFRAVEHPQLGRSITLPRSPYRSDAYDFGSRPAPALGAHSVEALREIGGLGGGEISELIELGIVRGDRSQLNGANGSLGASISANGAAAAPPAPVGLTSPAEHGVDSLPLAGVRVLDFCWMAAGPLITEMLANLGADVIKIESASGLDSVREFSHPPRGFSIDTGAFFNDTNTDKRSITLNLHKPQSLELIRGVLDQFDIVTNNFAPGAMQKFGLTYDELRAIKPDLIYASFPVMGTWGPNNSWRGIGNGVTGLSGVVGQTGQADRAPIGIGSLHTDFTLAPIAASQIVAALIHRERTGEGQEIEIAQYEAAVHLLDAELVDALVNDADTPRIGNRSTEYAPHGLFPANGNDEWLAVAVRGTGEWLELCEAIKRPDLAGRGDLRSLAGRKAAEDEIEAALAAWSSQLDPWRAAGLLQARGIPASPAETARDLVLNDDGIQPYFFHFQRGEVPFMVQHQPFTWNGRRLGTRGSPELGEHNEQVLKQEWGVSDERYVDLLVEQVIY